MAYQLRLLLSVFCVLHMIHYATAGGGQNNHKKFVIHVPLYIKHHHHTHTVYKHIHHKPVHEYKVLGYTHGDHGGHGDHGDHGGHGGGASDGYISGGNEFGHSGSGLNSGYGHSGGGFIENNNFGHSGGGDGYGGWENDR